MDDDAGEIFGAIIGFLMLIGLIIELIKIVIAIILAVAMIAGVVAVIRLIYKEVLAGMKKNLEDYIAEREEDLRIHSNGKEKLSLGNYGSMDRPREQYKQLRSGNRWQ